MTDPASISGRENSHGLPTTRDVSLSNTVFMTSLGIIGATYVLFIVAMLVADTWYMAEKSVGAAGAGEWEAMLYENPVVEALADRKIRYSIWLSLTSMYIVCGVLSVCCSANWLSAFAIQLPGASGYWMPFLIFRSCYLRWLSA